MERKWVIRSIGGFFGLIVFLILMRLLFVGVEGFFRPLEADVNRYAIENTKAYVDGAIRDLADYRRQYTEASDNVAKSAIQNAVRDRFPEFDADKIKSPALKSWFIKTRGY